MPRQPRFNLAGVPQHVIQRGNNRQPVFFIDADYERYLDTLATAAESHGCALHAYVLMPNHVHLLVTPDAPLAISKLMQSLGGRYVQYANAKHGRSGTLWDGRYKACIVDSERYLMTCYRYIELNPVRAGLAERAIDYPWSSHGRNAGGEESELIVEHGVYAALGSTAQERRSAYRALFTGGLDEALLRRIREAANQGRVLADEPFLKKMEWRFPQPSRPRKRGRPKARK